ncbi:venom protease-like isoform X2 [Venturia canescens]|uniref:venom protease-like isoform X2 n=1 Tax=Venturia canescens TaxID=32260 RepID=UPI001C9C8B7A|nr:venom protease-like isoform X2 [Venturia canescens]
MEKTVKFTIVALLGISQLQYALCQAQVDVKEGQSIQQYTLLAPPVCGWVASFNRSTTLNGNPVRAGDWPWYARLCYRQYEEEDAYEEKCGGVLISSRHVLTAAQCLHNINVSFVRLGEGTAAQNYQIERVTRHGKYSYFRKINDIGVIKLKRDVVFTDTIHPICLPTAGGIQAHDTTNANAYVVVPYPEYQGVAPQMLYQFQVPVVPVDSCRETYRNRGSVISEKMICAGGSEICQGSGGGPMMFPVNGTWYSIGIISYGSICGDRSIPTVLTRTDKYLDFILSSMN